MANTSQSGTICSSKFQDFFNNFPDEEAKLPQLFRFSSAFTLTLNQSLPSQEK